MYLSYDVCVDHRLTDRISESPMQLPLSTDKLNPFKANPIRRYVHYWKRLIELNQATQPQILSLNTDLSNLSN